MSPIGVGIKDGRGYGPYGMGYYTDQNGVDCPYGPNGERLTPDYDFRHGVGGYLHGLKRPAKTLPGFKMPEEKTNMGYEDRMGDGLDFLGCEELGALMPSPIAPGAVLAPVQVTPSALPTPSPLPAVNDWGAKAKAEIKKAGEKIKNLPVALGVGGSVGAVVGGGLGFWLWRSHRLFGGLLGGLIAGAGAGLGVGYGVAKLTGHSAKAGKGKHKKGA